MEDKRMVSKQDIDELVAEAVRRAKIETLMLAIRIQNDAISRASFRVAIHGHIMKLSGTAASTRK